MYLTTDEMHLVDNGLELTFDELKTVYENDNANVDCDCSLCRYYRQLMKEKE